MVYPCLISAIDCGVQYVARWAIDTVSMLEMDVMLLLVRSLLS